jgi:hypothetical protein
MFILLPGGRRWLSNYWLLKHALKQVFRVLISPSFTLFYNSNEHLLFLNLTQEKCKLTSEKRITLCTDFMHHFLFISLISVSTALYWALAAFSVS